jgi:sulfur carrier protein ThiS adenylyltransferase
LSVRYSRQELFAPIGKEGQRKIAQKHVLVVGAGALGSGISEAMVRAGVGKLTIVDRDYVEWSNLQRQQLYSEVDAAERLPKAIAAQKRLSQINSEVEIRALVMDVIPAEIEELVEGVDLILDGTDNFDTRLLINDVSQKYQVPWIYGACVGSYGLSYTILPGITPCLRCLLEAVPMVGMTCDTAGIIGPVVQMVVSYQTTEALKILVEDWQALSRKLVSFDLWNNQYAAIGTRQMKKRDCPSCGEHATYPYLHESNRTRPFVLCGRDTVQIRPSTRQDRDLDEITGLLLSSGIEVERNPYLLSFVDGNNRIVMFRDGRVFIHGTKDVTEAKKLYHRYFG